jgi:acylglycerol lipase
MIRFSAVPAIEKRVSQYKLYWPRSSFLDNRQGDHLMNELSFAGASGLNITCYSWRPKGQRRGVLVIVPGFYSHSGYYERVAEQLAADGLAVYSIDLRGRGKSDGERYYVVSFDDYVGDVSGLMKIAKSENPDLPIYLLGHSAGGVVSCLYALAHQSELAGFICESFAFQLPAPDFALAALKGLSHVFPHAHVLKLKNEWFSRDPKALATMNNDPLIAHEIEPTQTVAAMVHADERLKKGFPDIKLPLLILHGTADKAAKFEGSQFFYDKAGSADKTLRLYDGHFHDLLNDIDKEVVTSDIKDWIDKRVRA